jgi:hypothetical protein
MWPSITAIYIFCGWQAYNDHVAQTNFNFAHIIILVASSAQASLNFYLLETVSANIFFSVFLHVSWFKYVFYDFYQSLKKYPECLLDCNGINGVLANHVKLFKLVKNVNSSEKHFFAIAYFLASSMSVLYFYIAKSVDEASDAFRLICSIIALNAFIILPVIPLTCARVSYYANKPYSLINSIVAKDEELQEMNLRNRLDLLTFIEHLAGEKIGFTCGNFFTFTNLEFYLYIASACRLYFLFLDILK